MNVISHVGFAAPYVNYDDGTLQIVLEDAQFKAVLFKANDPKDDSNDARWGRVFLGEIRALYEELVKQNGTCELHIAKQGQFRAPPKRIERKVPMELNLNPYRIDYQK